MVCDFQFTFRTVLHPNKQDEAAASPRDTCLGKVRVWTICDTQATYKSPGATKVRVRMVSSPSLSLSLASPNLAWLIARLTLTSEYKSVVPPPPPRLIHTGLTGSTAQTLSLRQHLLSGHHMAQSLLGMCLRPVGPFPKTAASSPEKGCSDLHAREL